MNRCELCDWRAGMADLETAAWNERVALVRLLNTVYRAGQEDTPQVVLRGAILDRHGPPIVMPPGEC